MSECRATGYPGNGTLAYIDSIFKQAQAEEGESSKTLLQPAENKGVRSQQLTKDTCWAMFGID